MLVLDKEIATAETSPRGADYPVSMAFADYDRTRPQRDGIVTPKGITLTSTNKWVGDFCKRPVYEEYDAAEMSLSWYVAARDRGEPCIAIPIFPLRDPILAFVYTRADSGITKPSDLVGRRIGTQGYRYTINVWLRGLFKDHYGLAPEQVTWVTGEPEGNGYVPPAGIRLELKPGKSAAERLRDGEVDAIFAPRVPKEFQERQGWIRRLFPACKDETHRLIKRLGYIPVSHVIVMNEGLAQREPWIATSLYQAFVDAQRAADEVWRTEKMLSLVDSMFYLEEQQDNYGQDPFCHGLGPANRQNLTTFMRYAREQNYVSRELAIEELFAPATFDF